MVLGIILGALELIVGIYSIAHPGVLAVSLGFLIGFYFVESGISKIVDGAARDEGGNMLTVLYTVMGIMTIFGGFTMLGTPLLTFVSAVQPSNALSPISVTLAGMVTEASDVQSWNA